MYMICTASTSPLIKGKVPKAEENLLLVVTDCIYSTCNYNVRKHEYHCLPLNFSLVTFCYLNRLSSQGISVYSVPFSGLSSLVYKAVVIYSCTQIAVESNNIDPKKLYTESPQATCRESSCQS